jgi:hypothetical protein
LQHFNRQFDAESGTTRDKRKSEICKEKGKLAEPLPLKLGITLIEIPYWWDRKIDSLAATIYSQRPDVLADIPIGNPIPLSPPTKYISDTQRTSPHFPSLKLPSYRQKTAHSRYSLGKYHGSNWMVNTQKY